MPTLIEIPEPEIQQNAEVAEAVEFLRSARPMLQPARQLPAFAQRAIFSDSLLEYGATERRRKGVAATISFVLQCLLVAAMVIVPLWFTDALPKQQLLTFLVAPPPPPPPAARVVKAAQTNMLSTGQLRTPSRIPRKVEMIREEEAPPPAMEGGVVGGIPGGVPGGQLGGVIGGIISSTSTSTAVVPKLAPVKRVRISQGVTQGMVISKIAPKYPKIALAARVTGTVLLKAIISKEGEIKELQVVNGHPLLVPAAIEAVKQWRYRPYLLNGEPVQVETNITVTFQIES